MEYEDLHQPLPVLTTIDSAGRVKWLNITFTYQINSLNDLKKWLVNALVFVVLDGNTSDGNSARYLSLRDTCNTRRFLYFKMLRVWAWVRVRTKYLFDKKNCWYLYSILGFISKEYLFHLLNNFFEITSSTYLKL